MEKSAHYFIVGIFVSISVAALVGFLIWLMGSHEKKDYKYYTIYFKDSVSGLEEGASVEYKGIVSGKVMKMRISQKSSDIIKVDIGVNKNVPVHGGTKVTLETQGLTGLVRLQMATPPGARAMPPRLADEKYPVLRGSGTPFMKILDNIPVMAGQFNSTAEEAKMTARSMRRLVEKVQEDPSRILYQPSSRGVEIPP